MDIGSIFFILGLFLIVVLFLSRPFFEDKKEGDNKVRHRYSHLVAEKERLLTAIQELDLDLELKKIPPENHASKRAQLMREAAEVLKKLDQLLGKEGHVSPANQVSEGEEDQLEALIKSRRKELNKKSAHFCPHCGGGVQISDQYCTHCGKKI